MHRRHCKFEVLTKATLKVNRVATGGVVEMGIAPYVAIG